jgi:hypothetical protein
MIEENRKRAPTPFSGFAFRRQRELSIAANIFRVGPHRDPAAAEPANGGSEPDEAHGNLRWHGRPFNDDNNFKWLAPLGPGKEAGFFWLTNGLCRNQPCVSGGGWSPHPARVLARRPGGILPLASAGQSSVSGKGDTDPSPPVFICQGASWRR